MPEAGRVIALEPPRRSGLGKWSNGLGRSGRIGTFRNRRLTENKAKPGRSLVISVLAGLVPGLGHFYIGKIVFGLIFMAGVGGLLAATQMTSNDDMVRILLGITCTFHAISLLDLVSGYLRNHIANRIVTMGGITLILGTVIYWPLMRVLAPLQPVIIQGGHGNALLYQIIDGFQALLFTVFGFFIFSVIAHYIAKLIPRRNVGGGSSEGKDYGPISHS